MRRFVLGLAGVFLASVAAKAQIATPCTLAFVVWPDAVVFNKLHDAKTGENQQPYTPTQVSVGCLAIDQGKKQVEVIGNFSEGLIDETIAIPDKGMKATIIPLGYAEIGKGGVDLGSIRFVSPAEIRPVTSEVAMLRGTVTAVAQGEVLPAKGEPVTGTPKGKTAVAAEGTKTLPPKNTASPPAREVDMLECSVTGTRRSGSSTFTFRARILYSDGTSKEKRDSTLRSQEAADQECSAFYLNPEGSLQ